jgi:zinc protease
MRLACSIVVVIGLCGRALAAPVVQGHTLASGLEILVVENQAVPLVTVELGVRCGAMVEDARWSGLSHLTEHMFFRPNQAFPSRDALAARVRALGLLDNGRTTAERVSYHVTASSANTGGAMTFLRDAAVGPLFDPIELEAERRVVLAELDADADDPDHHLAMRINERVWWKYPTRKLPFDSRATVRAATTDDLRALRARYFLPNNAVLVVTGDVHAAAVFRQAEELFQGWRRGPDPFQAFPPVQHPPIARSEVVSLVAPVPWARGILTWQGPSLGDAADARTALLLQAATQDPLSRFQRDLVDSNACVSARLSWEPQRNVGPIALELEAVPTRLDDCVRAIVAELPRMVAPEYFGDDDLRRAARRFELAFAVAGERPSELAHQLTAWWAMAGLDFYRGLAVDGAGRPDLQRYLRRYMIGKPCVLGVTVPPGARAPDPSQLQGLLP